MQEPAKSSIPLAVKGALAGVAAAAVVGAAFFVLWRPGASVPVPRVEPAVVKSDKPARPESRPSSRAGCRRI